MRQIHGTCGDRWGAAARLQTWPGVYLDGRDVTELPTHKRRMGLLFQDDVLFPHLSVAGNLGFGLPRSVRRTAPRA